MDGRTPVTNIYRNNLEKWKELHRWYLYFKAEWKCIWHQMGIQIASYKPYDSYIGPCYCSLETFTSLMNHLKAISVNNHGGVVNKLLNSKICSNEWAWSCLWRFKEWQKQNPWRWVIVKSFIATPGSLASNWC